MRGLGPMIALRARRAEPERAKAIVDAAFERGLLLLSCGLYGNVIRLLPPLTISDEELDEGLGLLEESLTAAAGERHAGHTDPRPRQALRRRDGGGRRRPRHRAGRVLHHARPVRLREDDDAADDRRLRAARRGHHRARRRATSRDSAIRPARQHGLPGLRAVPAHDGDPERRVRAHGQEGGEGGAAPPRPRRSRWCVSPATAAESRRSSRAGSASAWRSRARSSTSHRCSSWTSRSARSTSSSARRCRSSSSGSSRRSGSRSST